MKGSEEGYPLSGSLCSSGYSQELQSALWLKVILFDASHNRGSRFLTATQPAHEAAKDALKLSGCNVDGDDYMIRAAGDFPPPFLPSPTRPSQASPIG